MYARCIGTRSIHWTIGKLYKITKPSKLPALLCIEGKEVINWQREWLSNGHSCFEIVHSFKEYSKLI